MGSYIYSYIYAHSGEEDGDNSFGIGENKFTCRELPPKSPVCANTRALTTAEIIKAGERTCCFALLTLASLTARVVLPVPLLAGLWMDFGGTAGKMLRDAHGGSGESPPRMSAGCPRPEGVRRATSVAPGRSQHGQGTRAAVGRPAPLPMQPPGQKTPLRIQSPAPSDKLKTSSLLKIHSYANKRRVVWWQRGCRMLWLECSSALV